MARVARAAVELWPRVMLVAAALVLVWTWGQDMGPPVGVTGAAVVLVGTVLAALRQAEAVAHEVGEPFGTLAVAVAVTVIEVALIVTLMISGGPGATALATDTVVAAVMISLNGIVGVSLLIGALRFEVIPGDNFPSSNAVPPTGDVIGGGSDLWPLLVRWFGF